MKKLSAVKYQLTAKDAKLHIAKGNSKIGKGIYAFSTLPGDENHRLALSDGTMLTNVTGTCSGNCSTCFNHGCYAVNSATLHHNVVIKAWGDNTLLLRKGTLFSSIDEWITKMNEKKVRVRILRVHVSGEFEDAKQIAEWNKLALRHPEVRFAAYTKAFAALDTFMQEYGDTAPNFIINISQWHGVANNFLQKYPGKFNVFTYDDSNLKDNTLSAEEKTRLQSLHHCVAVTASGHHAKDKNGNAITCDQCQRCYHKTGKETAVYAH